MKKLKAILRQRGVSQKELALATGLSQGAVSMILRGERHPRWDTVIAIAKALGVSTDELRDDLEEEDPELCGSIPLGQLCFG